ncbi:MAG: hypothetical protein EBR15_06050, partial [Gammaproteobacteria bacterium]|nr:hypothetical protein [Gammaproteobacteria bacterium]
PGRMERVAGPQEITVLVDYAHTEDAVRAAMETLRPLTRAKLWVVLGAGGRTCTPRSRVGHAGLHARRLAALCAPHLSRVPAGLHRARHGFRHRPRARRDAKRAARFLARVPRARRSADALSARRAFRSARRCDVVAHARATPRSLQHGGPRAGPRADPR